MGLIGRSSPVDDFVVKVHVEAEVAETDGSAVRFVVGDEVVGLGVVYLFALLGLAPAALALLVSARKTRKPVA